ncbi:MAG: hypothetical protein HZB61_10245 [Nitrospirae bacterium]|nr:hypothetical protein [Nitrospirota bacterium]
MQHKQSKTEGINKAKKCRVTLVHLERLVMRFLPHILFIIIIVLALIALNLGEDVAKQRIEIKNLAEQSKQLSKEIRRGYE